MYCKHRKTVFSYVGGKTQPLSTSQRTKAKRSHITMCNPSFIARALLVLSGNLKDETAMECNVSVTEPEMLKTNSQTEIVLELKIKIKYILKIFFF